MGVAHETFIFLYACLLGCGLGVVYDVFRLMRLMLLRNFIVVLFEDLMFSILCTLFTLLFLVEFCSGRFRVYVLLGELLGFLIYHFTLGEVVIRILKGILALLKGIFMGIYRFILAPIGKVFRFFAHVIRKLFVHILQCLRRLPFLQKFHLKRVAGVLYNKHNKPQTASKDKASSKQRPLGKKTNAKPKKIRGRRKRVGANPAASDHSLGGSV